MMYLNFICINPSFILTCLTVTYDVFKSNYVIVIQFASYCLTVTYDAFKFLLLTWFESFEIRLTVTYDVSNSI